MMLKKALLWAQKELGSSVERPRLEAEILLAFLLGCRREELVLKEIEDVDFYALKELVNRRKAHEPIEYITQSVSFYKEHFFIQSGALIPRPESELLVEYAIELIRKHNITRVAEIGVGSGALSISIANECKEVTIEASDISAEALEVAKANRQRFHLQDRVKLFECSMLNCLQTPQLLISNPPYIDREFELEQNILNYEPHEALFAPKRGLGILFDILDLIKQRQIQYAVCEMGYDQKEPLLEYAKQLGLAANIRFYKDLANFDRGFIYEHKN